MLKTFYQILGVDESASDGQIYMALRQIEEKLKDSKEPSAAEELRIAREAFAILLTQRNAALPHEQAASQPPGKPPKNNFGEGLLKLFQQPAFLAFLAAILCLLTYWNIETNKLKLAQTQRLADEKILVESERRNRELALKEAELAQKELELKARQVELEQGLVEASGAAGARRLAQENEANNQSLDVARITATAQARLAESKARRYDAESSLIEQAHQRQTDAENLAIKAEATLLEKAREQRLNGEDGITRSNPGMNRW